MLESKLIIRDVDNCDHNSSKFVKYYIIENIVEVDIYGDMCRFNINKDYLYKILEKYTLLFKCIQEIIKYYESIMEIDKKESYYKINRDLFQYSTHTYAPDKPRLVINHYDDKTRLLLKDLYFILQDNVMALKVRGDFYIDNPSWAKMWIMNLIGKQRPLIEIADYVYDDKSLKDFIKLFTILDRLYRKESGLELT